MNRKFIFLVCCLLFITVISGCIRDKDTIKVSGAYALYPMMQIWAEKYHEETGIRVEVSGGGAGKGMADALNGMVDIGMVSRDIYPEEIERGAFYVAVAKDCVVATINKNNPVVDDILQKGIKREVFVDIFITRNITTWGEVVGKPSIISPIHVYTRADQCGAAKTWAKYLGGFTQDDLTNAADSAVDSDPGLAETIRGDSLAIGYNNLNFAYDIKTGKPVSGIVIIPIDLNENGILEDSEKFYDTRDEIINAVKNGVYPSPPARELYLVTKDNFVGKAKEFVRWILTEGQKYIPEHGYIQLSEEKLQQELQKLEQKF